MRFLSIFTLFAALSGIASGVPAVTAAQNSASNVPAGLPNGNLPRGGLFILKGSELGPATFVVADTFPLQTTIAGTSVRITVNGTSVDGIMYYSGATQVAVILPSNTPLGTGTVVVTYNGASSAPFDITVVDNSFGVFTVSQTGSGDAIAFLNSDNSLVAPGNAANPGDVVQFWGTGLAPVNFDETMAAQQFDMTDVPVEAFVGGDSATILFRGRNACCSSIDVIYITIPAGTTGCQVPVTFKIGNIVSNTVTIAIASSGRVCTPNTSRLSQTDLSEIFAQGAVTIGSLSLSHSTNTTAGFSIPGFPPVGGMTSSTDFGDASFERVTITGDAAGFSQLLDITSFGACSVVSFSGSSETTEAPDTITSISLDAGSAISLTGPNGQRTLAKNVFGDDISYFSQLDANGLYLTAGSYTFTGPGGPDIPAFSASVDFPQPLVWTNREAITEVNRANGVTVTWSGGDPNGYVQITGVSFVSVTEDTAVIALFFCSARTSDQSFTVPSVVLLALPESGTVSSEGVEFPIPGSLGVSSYTDKQVDIPNVDYGFASTSVSDSISVEYH